MSRNYLDRHYRIWMWNDFPVLPVKTYLEQIRMQGIHGPKSKLIPEVIADCALTTISAIRSLRKLACYCTQRVLDDVQTFRTWISITFGHVGLQLKWEAYTKEQRWMCLACRKFGTTTTTDTCNYTHNVFAWWIYEVIPYSLTNKSMCGVAGMQLYQNS
jgi:hypothetical protein